MKLRLLWTSALLTLIASALPAQDPASPRVQFVTVEKDVKLEVVDWGGTGRAVVLLAGLGGTAHEMAAERGSLCLPIE